MADINCPKCGKPNPAGSTTCRYCKTRLPAGNQTAGPTPSAGNQDNAPDWLNSLRGDTSSGAVWNEQHAEENPQASGPAEGDVPDWLQRIRGRNQDGEGTNPPADGGLDNSGQVSSENEELPDWLTRTQTSANPPAPIALEDWLEKLREDEPSADSQPVKPIPASLKPSLTQSKAPPAQPDDETSEWLKGLQSWKSNSPLFDKDLTGNQAGQAPADSSTPDQKTPSIQPAAQENNETPDWLKGFSNPEPASATPQQPVNQETPDLLSRIPEPLPVSPDEKPSIGGHSGVTDWLRHLPAQSAETPPAETGPNQEAGAPDWLRDLRAQPDLSTPAGLEPTQNAAPIQPEKQPAEETPDWLKNLPSDQSEYAAKPIQESSTAPAEEIPDWLKDFTPNQTAAATPAQPVQATSSEPAEEIPDWLKDFSPNQAVSSAQSIQSVPAVPAKETPDWLMNFAPDQAEAAAPAQPAQSASAEPADETPDWLKNFAPSQAETAAPAQPTPSAPAEPADETPDWLKSFAPSQGEPAAPAQPAQSASAEPADETPDWLKSFAPSQAELAAPAQPAQSAPAEPTGETPDLLKNFAASQTLAAENIATVPVQANDVPVQPADEIPAQPLQPAESALSASQPPASDQTADQSKSALIQPPSSDEVPDWLQTISGRPTSAEASSAATPEQSAGDSTTDWLQSFGSAGLTASSPDSAGKPDQSISEPAAPENAGEAEPDWLSRITKSTQPADQETPSAAAPAIETGGAILGEIPDWLSNIKPQEAPSQEESGRQAFVLDNSTIELPASEEPGKNPFAGEGVPDWLSEVPQGAEAQAAQNGQADDSTEQLEPAQLPGWLQAMRPLEAVAPTAVPVDDQRVEKSGPLAGLKGILPGDDLVTQYRKPPSYSVKLKITEKQRASANLLEQMLGQESSPQAIPQDHVRIPQRLVRLVIALILIAVLLFPLLTSGGSLVPPAITPPANVVQFHTALDALPDGGNILLAVDYDPGFAGEMRFAASSVLERLIEKNESLVLVSTVPAGPVIAQNLIAQTLLDRPDLAAKYSLSSSVVNLGYLPGGAASLQEFASAPRQAAQFGFKAGVDASSPWLQPALQNIQDVSQFSMVMVLTDSLDSGRAWIEQVQPVLKTTPLTMVVSAQAAPLIQPYVDSGQVKAMISGISGGTAFEHYLKTAGVSSSADWNAYTSGLLVLVAFIFLGILLQIGTFLFSHRKGGG